MMSSKMLMILLIMGLLSVKVTNAQVQAQADQQLLGLLNAIVGQVQAIVGAIVSAITELVAAVVGPLLSALTSALASLVSPTTLSDQALLGLLSAVTSLVSQILDAIQQAKVNSQNCGILTNGKQYYIQSVGGWASGSYVVVTDSEILREGYMTSQLEQASKFTVDQKSCNVYGLCVNGYCMSRCEGCILSSGDNQGVAFHLNNSDSAWSQWKLISPDGVVGGPFNLEVDDGFLTYKVLVTGASVLTLNSTINDQLYFQFQFVEVGKVPGCNILENGQQYYLKDTNDRYVVVRSPLAYLEQIEEASATKFTAVQTECNTYEFNVAGIDGRMRVCEGCSSDTGDYATVRIDTDNRDPFSSLWRVSNSSVGGPYLVEAPGYGYVYYNTVPQTNALQLIMSLEYKLGFQFIKVN